jgi:hypothetical protein
VTTAAGEAHRRGRSTNGANLAAAIPPEPKLLPGRGRGRIFPADRADPWYQADLVVTCATAERGARAIAEPRPVVEVPLHHWP